jgi:hypothetical protein
VVMGRALVAVVVLALAAPTRADGLGDTLGQVKVMHALDLFSEELTLGLRTLSFELIDLKMDPRTRKGHFRLGAESMRLDSDLEIIGSYLRVRARLDLRRLHRSMLLALPPIDLVPRTIYGQLHLEVRVPLYEARF